MMLKYLLVKATIVCSFFSQAQVQVRDEPRHHNVFENEFVRILDVHIAPKDTTLYHLHNTPSVFIHFTKTSTVSQLTGQQPVRGSNFAGVILYDDIAIPRVHRVWNEDTSWFHVMDVELINAALHKEVELLDIDDIHNLFNKPQVNGYKIKASNNQVFKLPPSGPGYLFISLDNSIADIKINETTQHRIMKAGHYTWLNGKDETIITSRTVSEYALLQLK